MSEKHRRHLQDRTAIQARNRQEADSKSAFFMLVSCFAFSSTLKIEAICSSKRRLIFRTTGAKIDLFSV
jgi:hypothetical protein